MPIYTQFTIFGVVMKAEERDCNEIGILSNVEGIVAMAIIAMAMNVSDSIGDLMTAWRIRRHGRRTIYEDTENGFNWYLPSRPELYQLC